MGARGNFFAVDRRVWARVCALGKANPAAAYLIMARGAQGNLRTTAWSVNAIEERTALSNRAAKAAVAALIEARLVEVRRSGRHPLYNLRSVEEIAREAAQAVRPLTEVEQAVLAAIKASPKAVFVPRKGGLRTGWPVGSPCHVARDLMQLGLLREVDYQTYAPAAAVDAAGTDWIWLPNSIVDAAADEVPPVERLRQSRSTPALRLFVDLYHAQALAEDGGVNWRQLRMGYERKKLAEYAERDVFMFWPKGLEAWDHAPFLAPHLTGRKDQHAQPDGTSYLRDPGWPALWDTFTILREAAVVEFVPHLVESDEDGGGIIHPLAGEGVGEEAEREVAAAAHAAGRAMLAAIGKPSEYQTGVQLVPVYRHLRHVAVVGVLRLRHRPQTNATAIWFERMDEWKDAAARYAGIPIARNGLSQSGNGSEPAAATVRYQR